jgi:hypothetical protein
MGEKAAKTAATLRAARAARPLITGAGLNKPYPTAAQPRSFLTTL